MLLVAVLAVVDDLADGRIGIRRDLDQVEVVLAGALQGRVDVDDRVVAVGLNDANFVLSDFLVNANFISFSDGSGSRLFVKVLDEEQRLLPVGNSTILHAGEPVRFQ